MPTTKAAKSQPAPQPPSFQSNAVEELLSGLEDMIDGGRLEESDIPDDFTWLEKQIRIMRNVQYRLAGRSEAQAAALLKDVFDTWEEHGDSTEYTAVMRRAMYYLDANPNGLNSMVLPATINATYVLMQIYHSWAQCGDSDDHDDQHAGYKDVVFAYRDASL